MEPLIGTVINNLINVDDPVSPAYIKLQLDVLYKQTAQFGLNNIQLQKLIKFLCITSIITNETKLYIIKNCLFPCEYIQRPVIATVINNLGVPTIYTPYQITLNIGLQEALCEWLVKVYFIVGDEVKIDNAIWIHLWQYGHLQKWLTYIIIWNSRSYDVKDWKIQVIKKVGLKSSYKDGVIYATMILKKFQALKGYSRLISEAINELNAPAKKLQPFQNIKLQTKFFRQLSAILITTAPDIYSNEHLLLLVKNLSKQLSSSDDLEKAYPFTSNKFVNQCDHNLGGISTQELVKNWNSNNMKVKHLLTEFQDINKPLNVPGLIRIIGDSKMEQYQEVLSDIMKLHVDFVFQSSEYNETDTIILLSRFRLFSILESKMVSMLLDSHFNYENIRRNKNFFELIFGFNPILNYNSFEKMEVVQKQVFRYTTTALSLQNKNEKNYEIVPVIMIRFFFDIFNFIQSGANPTEDGIIRLFSKLGNLSLNRLSENPMRFFDIAGTMYYMSVLNKIFQSNSLYEHIPYILMNPEKLRNIVLQYDPILLNALCSYLVLAKGTIATYATKKESIRVHNQFLLDLTNYLWRNKISNSDFIFGIPTVFIKSVVQNIYLPSISKKDKAVFSLIGIPATSFVFYSQLRILETEHDCKIRYHYELTVAGFKKFIASGNNKVKWIPEVKEFDDLKRLVLKAVAGIEGYSDIALFLYTFIKSLTPGS